MKVESVKLKHMLEIEKNKNSVIERIKKCFNSDEETHKAVIDGYRLGYANCLTAILEGKTREIEENQNSVIDQYINAGVSPYILQAAKDAYRLGYATANNYQVVSSNLREKRITEIIEEQFIKIESILTTIENRKLTKLKV